MQCFTFFVHAYKALCDIVTNFVSVQILRMNLQEHLQVSMHNHLLLAVVNMEDSKIEINWLTRSNEDLRTNLVSFIALFFG